MRNGNSLHRAMSSDELRAAILTNLADAKAERIDIRTARRCINSINKEIRRRIRERLWHQL